MRPWYVHITMIAGMLVASRSPGQAMEAPPKITGHAALTSEQVNTGAIGRRIAAAKAGDTIEVGAGVYREHIIIDKPIRLIGVGRPTIDGGGTGDIVQITAPDVTIRGFNIVNTGIDLDAENAAIHVVAPRATIEDNRLDSILFGIDLRESSDSVLRNNRVGGKDLDIARRGDGIRLWRSDRALVEGNVVHDGRDAVLWYSTGIVARNNVVERSRYGLHLMYSDGVVIENNTLRENSVGVYVMYSKDVEIRGNRLMKNRGPSGYGIGLKETDRFTVSGNLITSNRVGVYLDGSPFGTSKPGEFVRNTLAYNDIAMTFLPAVRGNEIVGNNFIDNVEQISVGGRGQLDGNAFWKGEEGNYWSDYVGYDLNGDGVGDFVHESETLFENLMDQEPKLRLLLYSPTQQAIEFVGKAIPATRPEAKFVDEVPKMRAFTVEGLESEPASGWRLGLAGVAMMASGGVLAGLGLTRPRMTTRARGAA
jgi:nitrous oxidase accessory protein